MPQMAPMNWTLMMIMFIMTYMMMSTMIYFMKKNKINIKNNMLFKKKINWKW